MHIPGIFTIVAKDRYGLTFSHTEHQHYVALMDEYRTKHFTRITREEWKKQHEAENED